MLITSYVNLHNPNEFIKRSSPFSFAAALILGLVLNKIFKRTPLQNIKRMIPTMRIIRNKKNLQRSAEHLHKIKCVIRRKLGATIVSEPYLGVSHLIEKLFEKNIRDYKINENSIEINLHESIKFIRKAHSIIQIPKKVIFNVRENGTLVFDHSDYAPRNLSIGGVFIANWWTVKKIGVRISCTYEVLQTNGTSSQTKVLEINHYWQDSWDENDEDDDV